MRKKVKDAILIPITLVKQIFDLKRTCKFIKKPYPYFTNKGGNKMQENKLSSSTGFNLTIHVETDYPVAPFNFKYFDVLQESKKEISFKSRYSYNNFFFDCEVRITIDDQGQMGFIPIIMGAQVVCMTEQIKEEIFQGILMSPQLPVVGLLLLLQQPGHIIKSKELN